MKMILRHFVKCDMTNCMLRMAQKQLHAVVFMKTHWVCSCRQTLYFHMCWRNTKPYFPRVFSLTCHNSKANKKQPCSCTFMNEKTADIKQRQRACRLGAAEVNSVQTEQWQLWSSYTQTMIREASQCNWGWESNSNLNLEFFIFLIRKTGIRFKVLDKSKNLNVSKNRGSIIELSSVSWGRQGQYRQEVRVPAVPHLPSITSTTLLHSKEMSCSAPRATQRMQKQDESGTESNLQAVSGIHTLAPEKCFERGNDTN